MSHRLPHLQETVEEIGSILIFAGRPLHSHDCSKLVFLQYRTMGSRTNDSWGLNLLDLASGKRTLLDELSTDSWREEAIYSQVRTFGWSPDDRFFAYCRKKQKEIVITEIASGTVVATFSVSNSIGSGVWLSPETVLCTDRERILEVTFSGGQWQAPKMIFPATNVEPERRSPTRLDPAPIIQGTGSGDRRSQPEVNHPQPAMPSGPSMEGNSTGVGLTNAPIESLQAFSPETVLWQQGRDIWKLRRGDARPERLWQTITNELVEYFYAPEAQMFLLHFRGADGDFLAEAAASTTGTLESPTNEQRLANNEYKPAQVRWINHGQGYAWLNESEYSLNAPEIRWERHGPAARLPWRGEVRSFAVCGQQLYVMSSLTNEPMGLWKYDLVTGALEQLVANQVRPFQYAVSQPPLEHLFTNAAGKRLSYYLLEPVRLPAGGKVPVVFGCMGKLEKAYVWDRYAQTVANCGFCFVIPDRRNSEVSEWASDALLIYEDLKRRIPMDTNRVHLLGISIGAGTMNELLAARPELWRDVIYLSPGALPEPAGLRRRRVLVDIGGLDPRWGENSIKAKQFRDAAARAGAEVTLFIREGVEHNCRILSIEKERLHQLAAFLLQP